MFIFLYLTALIISLYGIARILLPELIKPNPLHFPQFNKPDQRIEKLKTLLAEKNKDISLLQRELKIFYVQINTFDKVKTVLEEEIHRLREQNRIFRSELGLPTVQHKENPIT